MNPLVNNSEQMHLRHFWTNRDGEHPKPSTLVNSKNVVAHKEDAVNGKWTASDPTLGEHAVMWVRSNVKWDCPLIIS